MAKRRRGQSSAEADGGAGDASPARAAIDVEGVVIARDDEGEGTLVAAHVTVDDGERTTVARGPDRAFSLKTGEGRVVEIRVARDRVRWIGGGEESGPYGSLAETRLGLGARDEAPGPHVRVTLRGGVILVGDRIAVRGVPSATRIESEGGHRDAAEEVVSALDAEIFSVGADPLAAITALDRQRHEPTRTGAGARPVPAAPPPITIPLAKGARACAIVAVLAAVVTVTWSQWVLRYVSWVNVPYEVAVFAAVIAYARWLRGRHFAPRPTTVGSPGEARVPWWGDKLDRWLPLAYLFTVGGYAVLAPMPSVVTFAVSVVALHPIAHAILSLYTERRFRRFAWLLLRPQSYAGIRTIEGTIEGGSPGMSTSFVARQETRWHTKVDANGQTDQYETTERWVESIASASSGLVAVRTTTNEEVVVDLQRGDVAYATRRFVVPGSNYAVMHESPAEGRVMVIGVVEGDRLVAKGRESLLVWGGSRGRLIAALLGSYARPLSLLALAWVITQLAAAYHPDAVYYRGSFVASLVSGYVSETTPASRSCDIVVEAYPGQLSTGAVNTCSARLHCDGQLLYGGLGMGQMPCTTVNGVVMGSDQSSFDGDLAVSIDMQLGTVWFGEENGPGWQGSTQLTRTFY